MLADGYEDIRVGGLSQEVHLPATSKLQLVEFIAQEMPLWRDHPDRPDAKSETVLTEHLCDHLNSASGHSSAWSHVQFRTETVDESKAGRKIDLAVKPRGVVLFIEGRRHTQFSSLFPIECKRLPVPSGGSRDEREYVITDKGSTGGIQRFKDGNHGASHEFAAMIAYIQKDTSEYWLNQINHWIEELSSRPGSSWSNLDLLHLVVKEEPKRLCQLQSVHTRLGDLGDLQLCHLWIDMS